MNSVNENLFDQQLNSKQSRAEADIVPPPTPSTCATFSESFIHSFVSLSNWPNDCTVDDRLTS